MDVSSPFDLDVLRGQLLGAPRPARPSPDGQAGQASSTRSGRGGVHMSLSAEGLARSRSQEQKPPQPTGSNSTTRESSASALPGSEEPAADSTGSELTEEERREVEELSRRDREVRAHEAAHKAAAGNLAKGSASFSYQNGPDGRRYAVGGEVSIDTSAVKDDPAATARKMERVRAAALAPADPSGQDRQVAATAAGVARQARAAVAREALDLQSGASDRASGRGEAEEASASGACPICGDGDHGPAQHRGEIDFHA